MITKTQLQAFIDKNVDRIAEILPGGLKDARGKWILVCPVMERFDLDFSKVNVAKKATEEAPAPKKSTKSKKSTKKK